MKGEREIESEGKMTRQMTITGTLSMRGGNYVLALIFMDVDDHEISALRPNPLEE